ncbi:MAG TPA: heme exporter protein CcmB, partial [Caulobacteraceae bacterium]|nr:heme exporter protein CcmB [Caulobacteraceae bacterium]
AWGGGGGPLLGLTFFATIATLLPLAIGAEPARLAVIATGAAWVALALSTLLSLERLFERDYEDGALDLLALGPAPLEAVCFGKCLAQWVATGIPLAVAAPIGALALNAPGHLAPMIFATALIGGLGFSFTGGIGAALSLGSRRGGVLIAVIVLPLFVFPIIFGAGAIEAYGANMLGWKSGIAFLAAYSLVATALGPFFMAAACRNAIS